jgi:hypothetical protein
MNDWRELLRSFAPALALAVFTVLVPSAHAQLGDSFSPADVAAPKCSVGWDYADSGSCVVNAEAIKKLDAASCKAAGFDSKNNVCAAGEAKAPAPSCTPLPAMAGTIKDKKCVYARTLPSSAPGNFLGDCLTVKSAPAALGLETPRTYIVTDQKVEADDKLLTLYDGKVTWLPTLGCQKTGGVERQVRASAVLGTGAERQGYTYGLLTMPYKYFPGQKKFVSGAPVGGYLGWRTGQAGSGWTTAAAFTIGSVTGETIDPTKLDASGKPTITGTTQLAALSLAAGFVFDVVKDPKGRPFKAGIFVGRDAINPAPTVQYIYNRKTWIALQIGYDFTDN